MIDIPQNQKRYFSLNLNFLTPEDFLQIAAGRFTSVEFIRSSSKNEIIVFASSEQFSEIQEFAKSADLSENVFPVNLKFLKADELMQLLPPSAHSEMIVQTSLSNLLFFKGSTEQYKKFLDELKILDIPKPQIKYELLVIQSSKNLNKSFKPEYSLSYSQNQTSENTESEISVFDLGADFSNILGINFNVISKLGYEFASSLNHQLSKSEARISTDTSLTGISGQEIMFQNTDTYRYIEYEYDKNNSSSTVGVTQTITSGLIINITGWISGNEMITMDINASISKQNSESGSTSSTVSTLPSTSERIVSTQLRAKSGQAIVIGGLLKDEENIQTNFPSILAHIPILGNFFKQKSKSKEQSEITIYIVPTLLNDLNEESYNENSESFNITKFCEKYIQEKI